MREPPPRTILRFMNRIMIATDGSDGGRAALDTSAELARASGAKATLV